MKEKEQKWPDAGGGEQSMLTRFRRWEYLNVALVLSVLTAILVFYKVVMADARAEGLKAGAAAEQKAQQAIEKAKQVETALEKYIERSDRADEVLGGKMDALYQHMITRQPQAVLEVPLAAQLDAGSKKARDAGP